MISSITGYDFQVARLISRLTVQMICLRVTGVLTKVTQGDLYHGLGKFDEIKRTVSLQMALDHYGIRLRNAGPNALWGKCPLPTHAAKKSTESFTATLSKGVGGIWACQSKSCIKTRGRVGGNVLDFVATMEQCSVRDAAIKLQTGFWFRLRAMAGSRLARNLARKVPRARNRRQNLFRKKRVTR